MKIRKRSSSATGAELPLHEARRRRPRHRRFQLFAIAVALVLGVSALYLRTKKKRMSPEGVRPREEMTFASVVLPSVVNPDGRLKRLEAIAETWGKAAHAIFVVHKAIGKWLDDYPRELVVPAEIDETMGVQRLTWVLGQFNRTDFVFMCNDHTFVLAPNLVCILRGLRRSRPVYLGRALAQRSRKRVVFNSGAAGYVLSQATLRVLKESTTSQCRATSTSKWIQGNPGLYLAECLESMGIHALDTRDADGRQRFHAYGPVRTVTAQVDEWYRRMHLELDWKPTVDRGLACCAPSSVSFHYVEAMEQRSLYAVLLESRDASVDRDKWIRDRWPRSPSDLGGYSKPYPTAEADKADVRALLFTHLRLAGNSSVCELNLRPPPPLPG